tara:strand:+ start:218 stop:736 length:519 start_codon:yes stop_codon:yes gene_type:complete
MKKKIFYKKNKFILNNNIFFIFVIFLLIFLFYFQFIKNYQYFTIPHVSDTYYFIPKDTGGHKIPNQDKKGLHLSHENFSNIIIKNDPLLKYVIQIYANSDYKLVKKKKEKLLTNKETIFQNNDLKIVIFKNNLSNEYLLIFKNFETRVEAFNNCKKYAYFLEKCIIVNVRQL